MKVAILGIGSELTDGQIVNKNASWISKKLKDQGVTTNLHLVVPDEKHLMHQGLEFCALHSDLIFVTGGLGPTSDDFTRDVIAAWSGKSLEFDQDSWVHIQERLTSRGYTVKEIQRQQCYFPEGSEVLKNREGTANAFTFEAKEKKIFVLPGPPREIEAIWQDSIDPWLRAKTQNIDRYITRTWDTLGVGESDVALIVEEVLKGVTAEKGYRVHLPYVEVKLSYFKSQEKELLPSIDRLTEALQFCTITRDNQDAAHLFAQSIQSVPSLTICDEVTGQFLIHRLMPVLRPYMKDRSWTFTREPINKIGEGLSLWLSPRDEHSCEVGLHYKGFTVRDILGSPYTTKNMKERRLQYFAETALLFWLKNKGHCQ